MTSKLGFIYKFTSTQVLGNAPKPKYHLALELKKGAFLFINSSGFDGSFLIDRNDWPEMPNEFSFISCNSVIRYNRQYFSGLKIEHAGKLSDPCIRRLRDHIAKSQVLETREINFVLQIIDDHFD